MTPTNHFRWLKVPKMRHPVLACPISPYDLAPYWVVLQQWWHINGEPPPSPNGEWRDVPVEVEQ